MGTGSGGQPQFGFKCLNFFLTEADSSVSVVAAWREHDKDDWCCYSGESGFTPDGVSSALVLGASRDMLAHLAATAACLRLLLKHVSDRDALDAALVELQDNYRLPPLNKASPLPKRQSEKEEHPLLSLLNGPECYPFDQTDFRKQDRKEYRTRLHADAAVGDEQLHWSRFRFHRHKPGGASATRGCPSGAGISDAELARLLQKGNDNNNEFRADCAAYADKFDHSFGDWVPLDELGSFLGAYIRLKIIGLDATTVANRMIQENVAWPEQPELSRELLISTLNKFHEGNQKGKRTYDEIEPLLKMYEQPKVLTSAPSLMADVPSLMAGWLCARPKPQETDWVKFGFTSGGVAPKGVHGNRAEYVNATRRLRGMECAFVRFSLAGNLDHPDYDHTKDKHLPPDPPAGYKPVTQLSELISRHNRADVQNRVPNSRRHVHPGDEFILVLDGEVIVQLENTGIWTPLRRGDYAHFTAEIPHAVWNLEAKPAVTLILRFFQLKRHSTRQRQIEALEEIETKMLGLGAEYTNAATKDSSLLQRLKRDSRKWIDDSMIVYRQWTRIAPWVHDRTRPPQDRLRAPANELSPPPTSEVQDLVGLSRFLQTHVAQAAHGYVVDIAPATVEFGELKQAVRELNATDARLDELERDETSGAATADALDVWFSNYVSYQQALSKFGERCKGGKMLAVRCAFEGVPVASSVPDVGVLDALSYHLGVPRILLDGYLSPPALRIVAVRGAAEVVPTRVTVEGSAAAGGGSDWVRPPADEQAKNVGALEYMIPSRVLANSDISVVLLVLRERSFTSWNHHPGFEAVIPLDGQVTVEFRKKPLDEADVPPSDPAGPEEVLLYRSTTSHRVRFHQAGSGGKARVIVIRFNILGGME